MKLQKALFIVFAIGLIFGTANLACATTLTLFGPGESTTTTDLPTGPPDPAFTNSSLFDFNDFFRPTFGGDSPNPLPRAAYKESELAFVLAMDGGFGPSGRVDPIVASQTFQFFIQGSFWSILGKLEFSPATTIFIRPNDVLTFSGDVVHLVAPHSGERAPGDAIPFNIELNGGKSLSVNRPIPPDVIATNAREMTSVPVLTATPKTIRAAITTILSSAPSSVRSGPISFSTTFRIITESWMASTRPNHPPGRSSSRGSRC